ncbi:MAG: Rod binding domain-containing protein [Planctomycetota bacterium]|jgi:Rod binding domain-containing protein
MDGISGLNGGLQARNAIANQAFSKAEELGERVDDNTAFVTDELEALFSTLLVKEMRQSLPKGMFGDGPGRDIFEGWFDEHLGRSLADGGALELAGIIKTAQGNNTQGSAE